MTRLEAVADDAIWRVAVPFFIMVLSVLLICGMAAFVFMLSDIAWHWIGSGGCS